MTDWTIKEPRGVWASQVFTLSLTLAGCLWAFFSNPRQGLQPTENEVVKELFVRGCKLAVHHSIGAGKTTARESPSREAQQQALAQEVQQLRKALQESCALQHSCGERIVLSGGISRLKPAWQEAIESMGAHFMHHTGECPRGR